MFFNNGMFCIKRESGYGTRVLYQQNGHWELEPTGTQSEFEGNQLELRAMVLPPKCTLRTKIRVPVEKNVSEPTCKGTRMPSALWSRRELAGRISLQAAGMDR